LDILGSADNSICVRVFVKTALADALADTLGERNYSDLLVPGPKKSFLYCKIVYIEYIAEIYLNISVISKEER
jgi:hypothetical protein